MIIVCRCLFSVVDHVIVIFIDQIDKVFILEVDDIETIFRRLDERVARDPTDFGGKPKKKELVAQLHQTKRTFQKKEFLLIQRNL